MKKMMLVCSTGLTTDILVAKIVKIIFSKNLAIDVSAVSGAQALTEYHELKPDIVLLSPQVRYMKKELEMITKNDQIPLSIIDMKDYGLLDGETILFKAMTLLGLVMK